MNYGGSMPDWHQYNTSQTNEVTASTQNANTGHLGFMPGVSPPTLNTIGLNTEGLNKHQNDANFNTRNYQSFNNVSSGSNIPNTNPLASMVQMQDCIGHYGSPNTRNPMLDNINASVDPRNTAITTINDEIGYRSNQVPFNGPIGHLSGPACNLNAPSGPGPVPVSRTNSGQGLANNPGNGTGPGSIFSPSSRHGPALGSGSGPANMGPQNTNIGSVPSSGKPGPPPSFIPCKGLCCSSDPNINYQQWEKYGMYQSNTSYRDNLHSSNYQVDNRHYGNNCNFRKDNSERKDVMGTILPNTSAVDHRRNFADYKYHKDHVVHRNYSTSTSMFHNYPIQSYNYPTDHQKYPYPVKEHKKTNNMNMANSGLLKQQEQNFLAQQKYNNKQFQYQNGSVLPKRVPTLNVNTNITTSQQNPYFNSQFSRNMPADISHKCPETTENATMVNRMQSTFVHSSPPQHQMYQHKIAMQKFSMENHLRELSRIPGYQSHPKYKEYVLRYREILKVQQTVGYQNPMQQASRVATPVNTGVPPINLQFDHNGMLINSSYLPDGFPKLQHAPTVDQSVESIDKQTKDQTIAIANEKCQQPQQSEQLMIQQQGEHIPSPSAEAFHKQNQFSIHKDFNQNQLKVQVSEAHSFDTLNTDTRNETMLQQKASKEFTNKPDLDVRQFLANWDETDDEDGTTTNLSDTILNETTPVVVVSYEDVDLLSKTAQTAEASRRSSFCSNDALESGKEDQANIIATQDCLTISYSPSDNAEFAEPSKRTIGQGVVKPGSIIHCISNGPDEIPTIHIVDNLEISNILGASNDQVIQTLEKQKTISFFRERNCDDTEEMENMEQQKKEKTHVLASNYNTALDDASKTSGTKDTDVSETVQVTPVLRGTEKNNLDVADSMGLKKQHSFEESHNPDDISLPDLPTSECTPISTTLNTPIHSDTEETSQNMEDLSISTNPIEVMQNSSVISFTQLNTEEKVKNRSLGALGLEFQKDNCYKNNESGGSHEEDVSLNNFDFSNTPKGKSTEIMQNKQVKSSGTSTVRKKSFLIDSKENDTNLTSMEYELKSQHEAVEDERNLEYKSQTSIHEGRHKSIDSKTNFVPIACDDESRNVKNDKELFKKKRVKTLLVSTNTSSEVDLTGRKKVKRIANLEDKCIDRYLAQKRDTSNLRQSKNCNVGSSQGGGHSLCHTSSQYKHYSTAVIKDNVNLGDKRLQGTTDSLTMNSNNIKDRLEEPETTKQLSSKAVSVFQESIHSQTSKLLQKDLKTVGGTVRYTAEEIRLLKEYRKKDKLENKGNKSKSHSFKAGMEEELQKIKENSVYQRNKLESSQIKLSNETLAARAACSEQDSVTAMVCLDTENLEVQEETKDNLCSKNLITNADFGYQVANVNLKIKEKDLGKDGHKLILGDKGLEHKEGIKIEIKVSCAERTSKEQEQNRRIGYGDRTLYEVDNSLPYSKTLENQRKLHYKDEDDNTKLTDKLNTVVDAENDAEPNLCRTLKRGGRASLESDEGSSPNVSEETSNSFNKTLHGCVPYKDAEKMEMIETNNFCVVHADIIKSKSAISNTAIVDANNKVKTDGMQGSMSVNEEVVGTSQSIMSKKLPKSSLVDLSTKSLNSLKNLDFNFEKLEYKRNAAVHLDRCNRVGDVLEKDGYVGKWKKPKIDIFEDCDIFQSSSGYANPIFSSIDKLEDLHTVPVYTTKDGKISYSPNCKFTYHELMMEARKQEVYSLGRKSHYAEIWNNYYNAKFRKLYKKKRHGFSEKKKNEYKDTKYLYDRKRNYSNEFFSKNHVRYKDYVHSIRNNNAVWSDHCNKVDKIYSSSDSDEEILNQTKIGCVEVSDCRKTLAAIEGQSAMTCQFDRNEVVLLELDQEEKKEEDYVPNVELHEDQDIHVKGAETVEFEIFDIAKGNQDNNNCNDSTVYDKQSDTVQLNSGKENVLNIVGETSMLDNPKLILENLKNETENNECINLDVDEVVNKITVQNGEESICTEDKSLDLKLLNEESLLNKENLEHKGDEDRGLSKESGEQNEGNDINVSQGNKTFLNVDNDTEKTEKLKTNENFETNYIRKSESEVDNNVVQVSKESSDSEISDKVSTEIVEFPEQKINLVEENNSEHNKENNQIGKTIEPLKEQKNDGENKKEKGKSIGILKHESDISLINEISAETNSMELESQIIQSDESINEPNDSEMILVESTRNEKDITTNSEKVDDNVDTEEQNFTGFPKNEIPNIDDNDVAEVDKNVSASNAEETIIEPELIVDDVKDENGTVELPIISEQKTDLNRDTSLEEGISALSVHCTMKNSPTTDPEIVQNKNAAEENEEEETQGDWSEQVPSGITINSLNINTAVKTIPKLVIKKTDALNSKSESSLDCADVSEHRYDGKLLSELRPKIPKMIIVKNRSRSVTPTVEVLEKNKSLLPVQNAGNIDFDSSDSESYTLKYNNYENKVPKVKIKLEDISSKDLKLYLKRKAMQNSVPKVKIKKLKSQENKKFEMQDTLESGTSDSEAEKNFRESMTNDIEIERIPKLKLKRQEESKPSSPDRNRGRDLNNAKVLSKRNKRTKEEESSHTPKYDNSTVISEELKRKFPQCITEKIPKVIIKRTQIGTEFKCEISKRKKSSVAETSKWQPKVKLHRLHVLDYMVKGLKQSTTITLKNVVESSTSIKDNINDLKNKDSIHDGKVKLCRSNSTSSLTPIKFKQRRLSDADYMKVNQSKSVTEVDRNLATNKLINSENANYMKVGGSTLLPQNKLADRNQNERNENRITKHSFEHILLNEDNDRVVMREEYLPFGTKDDTPVVEDKFLDSVMPLCNYDDNDNSIIKVDSSDESQTTIEILPASPDNSEDDIKHCEFENSNRINGGDAIPTQLELELELIDNNNIQSNALLSKNNNFASNSKNAYNSERSRDRFFNEFQCASQSEFGQNEYTSVENEQSQSSEKKSKDYFYCNDLLVKEVLAAKEALKKCLTKPENEDIGQKQLRPRTVAEKKQGFSFTFKNLAKSPGKSEDSYFNNDEQLKTYVKCKSLKKKEDVEGIYSKQDSFHSTECPTASTCGDSNVPEQTTISLKTTKKFGQTSTNTGTNNINMSDKNRNSAEELHEEKSDKESDRKNINNISGRKTKEDNMPLLVPEFALNIDSSSDRDSSRSPPVITNQEEIDQMVEDAKIVESKVICQTEELEENKKHSYKDCEMTIADIITQLAYHEKATIKHKRYCNLCERWFPTTSRHRRHLAGYQHRYMELTQRKSIHALFVLFTGKPCPRLLPAHVIRTDCSIGELTPLQIAVQDIAKCVEYTEHNLKTKE